MRLKRKRAKLRAWRSHYSLKQVADRTDRIGPGDILLFSTFRDEYVRLPYFVKYYRDLGVSHFLMVDNDSDDGGREYLADQPDVSVWTTKASYKRARFGVDWLNWLQGRYGHGHWTLVVDPDEFFVYPFCDTRPIRALTDWLDVSQLRSFGAMLLDMYPKGRIDAVPYRPGQDPIEIASWFDPGNYMIAKNNALEISGFRAAQGRGCFSETHRRRRRRSTRSLWSSGTGAMSISARPTCCCHAG